MEVPGKKLGNILPLNLFRKEQTIEAEMRWALALPFCSWQKEKWQSGEILTKSLPLSLLEMQNWGRHLFYPQTQGQISE